MERRILPHAALQLDECWSRSIRNRASSRARARRFRLYPPLTAAAVLADTIWHLPKTAAAAPPVAAPAAAPASVCRSAVYIMTETYLNLHVAPPGPIAPPRYAHTRHVWRLVEPARPSTSQGPSQQTRAAGAMHADSHRAARPSCGPETQPGPDAPAAAHGMHGVGTAAPSEPGSDPPARVQAPVMESRRNAVIDLTSDDPDAQCQAGVLPLHISACTCKWDVAGSDWVSVDACAD